jgi:hypothetical protein
MVHIHRSQNLVGGLMLATREQGVGNFNALMRGGNAMRTQAFGNPGAGHDGVAG